LGGQASEAYSVENYPGYDSISGVELMRLFSEQAKKYAPKIIFSTASKIEKQKNIFKVFFERKLPLISKTVVLCLGSHYRELGIPGEKKFLGRGVGYCPTCDAAFYKDKTVAVIGGGDSALTSAILLSRLAKKIYLIHCLPNFQAQALWQKAVNKNKKITIILSASVKKIVGNELVNGILLDKPYNKKNLISLNGIFIKIGSRPSIDKLTFIPSPKIKKTGHIVTDYLMRTSVQGLFAAGDITAPSDKLRQIITAAAEGSIATASTRDFLEKNN